MHKHNGVPSSTLGNSKRHVHVPLVHTKRKKQKLLARCDICQNTSYPFTGRRLKIKTFRLKCKNCRVEDTQHVTMNVCLFSLLSFVLLCLDLFFLFVQACDNCITAEGIVEIPREHNCPRCHYVDSRCDTVKWVRAYTRVCWQVTYDDIES